MKTRFTKVVAVVAAVLMLITLVPVAALPEIDWPALSSVFGGSSADDAAATMPVDELTATDTEGYYQDANGNIYVDLDGDGIAEILQGDTVSDEDFWDSVTLGKDTVTDDTTYNEDTAADSASGTTASGVDIVGGFQNNAYEPASTNNENHPFLPGGNAWINLKSIYYGAPATPEYPIAKWSANTSVYNTTEGVFPDVDLIDATLWSGDKNYESTVQTSHAGGTGYAYNRFDAMQGKWGVTLNKYTQTAVWEPKGTYSDQGMGMFNISDTPYLYFSTEMTNNMEIAISLQIAKGGEDIGKWYTITDNNNRPGVGNDTRDYSMIPSVTVSADDAELETNLAKFAGNDVDSDEYLYTNGASTGCIDFSMLLDVLTTSDGHKSTLYYVQKVRVDLKGANGNASESARINYLYFGPNYGSIFTPQVNVGQTNNTYTYADNRETASGWENGQLVSITNTPNAGQVITIDTTFASSDEYTTAYSDNNRDDQNDQNDNTQLSEATDKPVATWSDDQDPATDEHLYVTVSIPVRKWFNALSDARKLVLTMETSYDMANSGTVTGSNTGTTDLNAPKYVKTHKETQTTDSGTQTTVYTPLNPVLSLWGNGQGSVGAGQNVVEFDTGPRYYNGGTRYANEQILGVMGTGAYLVEPAQTFNSSTVDRTLGNSANYNYYYTNDNGTKTYINWNTGESTGETKPAETWYDILRSPYMYDNTVKADNDAFGLSDETGYVYVSAIRVCVPAGTLVTITNMHCEGNSAGLNMYNTDGTIAQAYDGGAGVHPNVTLGEATADDDDTKQTSDTVTPAAYGPYLRYSNYTIYDLVDRESKTMSYSDGTEDITVNNQTIYGHLYQDTDTDNNPYSITKYPGYSGNANNSTLGCRYPGTYFTVYATMKVCNNTSNVSGTTHTYGLVSVATENGIELGWTDISREAQDMTVGAYIHEYKGKDVDYYDYSTVIQWEKDIYTPIIKSLQDTWVYSKCYTSATFRDETNADSTIYDGKYPTAALLTGNDTTYGNGYYSNMMPANMKNDPTAGGFGINEPNSVGATRIEYNSNTNTFSLKNLTASNYNDKAGKWGASITKTLSEPIVLQYGSKNFSYPVFYYDISKTRDNNDDATSFVIALTLEVNGERELYYVNPNTEDSDNYENEQSLIKFDPDVNNEGARTESSASKGHYTGYISLEGMIRGDKDDDGNYKNDGVVKVVSVSLVSYDEHGYAKENSNLNLHRLEFWTEKQEYIDDINTVNNVTYESDGTKPVTAYDGFNIINEAYFYNHEYSTAGDPVKYVDGVEYYDEGDAGAEYGKKGWSGSITYNLPSSNTVTYGNQSTFGYFNNAFSTDIQGEKAFEYQTSLGHMRVWVPSATKAQFKLTSDRPWNMSEYKYLYYSYSVRDTETGIAVENDNNNTGMEIVVKEATADGYTAYYQNSDWWDYNLSYTDGTVQTYAKSANGVVNLYNLTGEVDNKSLNEIIIYLNNEQSETAEFYINYLYLSNEPPEKLLYDVHTTTEYQYYYLMDNTGDRYSARFPTIDNVTGDVTDADGVASRVNPIKVVRGQTITTGTFFNGSDLNSVTRNGTPVYGEDSDEAIAAIWFYQDQEGDNETNYWNADYDEIMEYYKYKDRTDEYVYAVDDNGNYYKVVDSDGNYVVETYSYTVTPDTNGKTVYTLNTDENGNPVLAKGTESYIDTDGDIYDMRWSLGRWYLGGGNDSMNVLEMANYKPAGHLLQRYAADDRVLLRAGIDSIKELTYYNANGGQFVYGSNSSVEIESGVLLNENNFYITESGIQSYFSWPTTGSHIVDPVKAGYKFEGWIKSDNTGKYDSTIMDYLMVYDRNDAAGEDYFIAKWSVDNETWPEDATYTVTFLDASGKPWFTREAKNMDNTATNGCDRFEIIVPNVTWLTDASGAKKEVRGWYIYDPATQTTGTTLIAPGAKISVSKSDISLVPALSNVDLEDNKLPITITVNSGVKLYLFNGMWDSLTAEEQAKYVQYGEYACTEIKSKDDGGTHGIYANANDDGTTTYSNIPMNVVLVAAVETADANKGWIVSNNVNGTSLNAKGDGMVGSVVGTDSAYKFTAFCSMTLNYNPVVVSSTADGTTTDTKFGADDNGVVASMMGSYINSSSNTAREMIFVSQVTVPDDCKLEAAGTLYTKDDKIDALKAGDGLDANFRLKASDSDKLAAIVNNNQPEGLTANVRAMKSSKQNDSGQYYLMVTENKGKEVTYYARTYVIYSKTEGTTTTYYVAYSDVICSEHLDATVDATTVTV